MEPSTTKPATVDAYIAQFNMDMRTKLGQIRSTILQIAPKAVESISYGMPAYKLNNKPLVYFAGYDHHIGLYATPVCHEAFAAQLAAYKQGKGSVQFPHSKPLPLTLIGQMVAFRADSIAQNTDS